MKSRLIIIALLAAALALAASGCVLPMNTSSGRSTGSALLQNGTFESESVQLQAQDFIVYNVTADGGPVNMLFMDAAAYQQYQDTVNGSGTGWKALVTVRNVTAGSFNYTVTQSGTYYTVIDNTGKVPGGADGSNDVFVKTSCVYT